MGDEDEYLKIAAMSERELLDYVIENPNYLIDSYFAGYDTAILNRHAELTAARSAQGCVDCAHFSIDVKEYPCILCKNNNYGEGFPSHWAPKPDGAK